jgi:hypothetical protein
LNELDWFVLLPDKDAERKPNAAYAAIVKYLNNLPTYVKGTFYIKNIKGQCSNRIIEKQLLN